VQGSREEEGGGEEAQVKKLNFPLAEYSDDEVAALQGLSQEGVIQKLRRAGHSAQEECAANQSSRYTGLALF
jgi:hypothetical protein